MWSRSASRARLIALLLVSSSAPLGGCSLPTDKAGPADTGAGPSNSSGAGDSSPPVDTAPVVDTSASVDTSAPVDTSPPVDTSDVAICEECVLWAAANGDTFEVSEETDPSDCDGDGYTNTAELAYGYPAEDGTETYTNPCLADTDQDGISDLSERGCLNPTVADTDKDGVSDGEEVAVGTDPCVMICEPCVERAEAEGVPFYPNSEGDCDGDGVANVVEEAGSPVTEMCLADTDGDGLDDATESGCEDPTVTDSDGDGLGDLAEREMGSSSCLIDTDGDGLLDVAETAETVGTVDADGDGLSDFEEVITYGTSPIDPDTDNDCFPDRYEVKEMATYTTLDPVSSPDSDLDGLLDGEEAWELLNDAAYSAEWDSSMGCGTTLVFAGTDPNDNDSDNDGLLDGDEVHADLTGNLPSDPNLRDGDWDGLKDSDERSHGTDPMVEDTDGDCLLDGEEVEIGTEPTLADTDGDGIDDGDEVGSSCGTFAAETDPSLPDTDGDGLSDRAEQDGSLAYVTDPVVGDTDLDGLDDGKEYVEGTRPDLDDTDGDGYNDGDEVSWGATSTSTLAHYALASNYPDDLDGVNDQLECSSVKNQPGSTFVTAMGSAMSGDYYYLSSESVKSGGTGSECVCTVSLSDVHPTPVTGATVWLETAAHSTAGSVPSKWTADQNPRGVALYLPFFQTTTDNGYRYSLDSAASSVQNFEVTAMPEGIEYWFAFNDDPTIEDTAQSITTNGDDVFVNRQGGVATGAVTSMTVVVSKPNNSRQDIASCNHLAAGDGSRYNLKVRLDWMDTARVASSTCVSGAVGRTLVDLRALAAPDILMPLPVGGEARFAGADLYSLRVVDWRGLARLELRDALGRRFNLDPSHPVLRLEQGPVRLAGATWRAVDAAGHTRPVGPLVELQHRGGAGCQDQPPAQSASISWAHLDAWLRATTGLELGPLLHREQPLDAAPFRLELQKAGSDPSASPARLRLNMPGIGPVLDLPLRTLGDNRYEFALDRPDLRLRGQILVIGEGMFELRITGGAIGRGPQALVLNGAQLRLGKGRPRLAN